MRRSTVHVSKLRLLFGALVLALAPAVSTQGAFAQAPSAAEGPPPTLEALLQRFASSPGFEARFVEEKRIALLAVPLRSEGRIWFAPPGRLMRRVERPEPSAALIADGRLRMQQGDAVEEIAITDNPVLRGFIDSFRAVLAGDRAALARYYDATYTRNESGWELRLRPRDDALRRFLREIHLSGTGVVITEMRMTEMSGDETRTTFSQVDTRRSFSEAELRTIFRVR